MPTRNVVLTDHHERVIDHLVKTGRYQNASEVLREGLRLIEQREAENAARLKALQEAARVGMAAVERGDVRSFDTSEVLMDHLRAVSERGIARANPKR